MKRRQFKSDYDKFCYYEGVFTGALFFIWLTVMILFVLSMFNGWLS